jgi:hypothetical protein
MCRMHLLKIILDTKICQEWKRTIFYEYTQEESGHNTVMVFGGYLSRCSFLTNTNRSEKVCDHFHVTFCLCLSVVI